MKDNSVKVTECWFNEPGGILHIDCGGYSFDIQKITGTRAAREFQKADEDIWALRQVWITDPSIEEFIIPKTLPTGHEISTILNINDNIDRLADVSRKGKPLRIKRLIIDDEITKIESCAFLDTDIEEVVWP